MNQRPLRPERSALSQAELHPARFQAVVKAFRSRTGLRSAEPSSRPARSAPRSDPTIISQDLIPERPGRRRMIPFCGGESSLLTELCSLPELHSSHEPPPEGARNQSCGDPPGIVTSSRSPSSRTPPRTSRSRSRPTAGSCCPRTWTPPRPPKPRWASRSSRT